MTTFQRLRMYNALKNGWIQDFYIHGIPLLPTQTPLDIALNGGLAQGITVLGGVASAGKSSLACQIAANVSSAGKRVLYFTLDDTWGNIYSRCMSSWTVDHKKASYYGETPEAYSWSALKTYREQRSKLTDEEQNDFCVDTTLDKVVKTARIFDAYTQTLAILDSIGTVSEIENAVKSMVEENQAPDLVIVDYLQQYQIGSPDIDKQEYTRVSEVANRLQRLSLWSGIPLLALSSLRKQGKKDDIPSLDWYRGSAQIGYAAWAGVILTRGEDTDDGTRVVSMHVVKNKNGKSGFALPVRFYGGFSYFKYDENLKDTTTPPF